MSDDAARPVSDEPFPSAWVGLDEEALRERLRAQLPSGRAVLMLIDGRSGSGKSTLAAVVARLLDAEAVHTDDIAWQLHPIEWEQQLREGVLQPWRRGEAVAYRPPGWFARGREGAVSVRAGADLIVEGVGAGREGLAAEADLVVWVSSDPTEARRRGIARDVELGRTPAAAVDFWEEWERFEAPFLAADQPWERAHLVVNGTPTDATPGLTWVAEPVAATREDSQRLTSGMRLDRTTPDRRTVLRDRDLDRDTGTAAGRDGDADTGTDPDRDTGTASDRDRDADGRARQARPRDALGRPLPYGASGVEPISEEPLPGPETIALACAYLREGRPFAAHETFEVRWKTGPDLERPFWQGLAQVCAGLTHRARGNAVGAARLIERGLASIEEYAETGRTTYGLDPRDIADRARSGRSPC